MGFSLPFLDRLPSLPIFIELNTFATSGHKDLLNFAAIKWDEYYGFQTNDARGYMHDMLERGEALLLLDALDESALGNTVEEAEASYQRTTEAIKLVATRYRQAPIVITARKIGYRQRESLIGFTEFELQAFRPEDIKQFVTQWFNAFDDPAKPASIADLMMRLEQTPHILALATNPLLLSLIVRVYESQFELPKHRAALYKRCVDLLLREWDGQRRIRRHRGLEEKHIRQLLIKVAWRFHQKGRRYFPKNELLDEIAHFLPTVQLPAERNEQVLEVITSENGLLKEQAQGFYAFFHLTFQEYFVAQHMAESRDLRQLLMHRGDPWWEEVCYLYAGDVPDASALLRALMGKDGAIGLQEDVFHTNLILAGGCLVARPTVEQVSLWQEIVSLLKEMLVSTPYVLTRERIVQILVSIGEKEVNEFLLSLLADQHMGRELRCSIALALRIQREPAVVSRLRLLFNDARIDSHVRSSIVQALGTLGERSLIPQLLRMLQDQQLDFHMREGIVRCLGILDGKLVLEELRRLLRNEHTDWYIRSRIAQVLGVLGERFVASDLLHLLSHREHIGYSASEVSVLVNVAQALRTLGDRSMIPNMLELLQRPQLDPTVRGHIAQALGIIGDRSVVPRLEALLHDQQTDISTRSGIIYALAHLGVSLDVPDLLALLQRHPFEVYVASTLLESLGILRDPSVVPTLLECLKIPLLTPYIQGCIVEVLGILGEDKALHSLLDLLANSQVDTYVRIKVAQTLKYFANILTIEQIKSLVEFLDVSDVKSDIHYSLWIVSRRKEIRIFVDDTRTEDRVRVVAWRDY